MQLPLSVQRSCRRHPRLVARSECQDVTPQNTRYVQCIQNILQRFICLIQSTCWESRLLGGPLSRLVLRSFIHQARTLQKGPNLAYAKQSVAMICLRLWVAPFDYHTRLQVSRGSQ